MYKRVGDVVGAIPDLSIVVKPHILVASTNMAPCDDMQGRAWHAAGLALGQTAPTKWRSAHDEARLVIDDCED